jgi:innexin
VDAAIKYETVDKFAEREKLMEFLSGHITSFINAKNIYKDKNKISYVIKRYTSFIFFWTGKRFGNYLIILYTICKFLYLINVFGQLFLMTRLLGISNYHSLGLEILSRMAMGHDMIANHYFPKVTHCDFKVRELGNDHQYTVQCVLSINIFTEKIYIILWFWFVVLTALTFFDLILFLSKICWPQQRYKYVKKHVLIFNDLANQNQLKTLNKFAKKHLKPDIVFVLKILAANVNGMVVSELVKKLWEAYYKTYYSNDLENNYKNIELKKATSDEETDDQNDNEDASFNDPTIPKFPNRSDNQKSKHTQSPPLPQSAQASLLQSNMAKNNPKSELISEYSRRPSLKGASADV